MRQHMPLQHVAVTRLGRCLAAAIKLRYRRVMRRPQRFKAVILQADNRQRRLVGGTYDPIKIDDVARDDRHLAGRQGIEEAHRKIAADRQRDRAFETPPTEKAVERRRSVIAPAAPQRQVGVRPRFNRLCNQPITPRRDGIEREMAAQRIRPHLATALAVEACQHRRRPLKQGKRYDRLRRRACPAHQIVNRRDMRRKDNVGGCGERGVCQITRMVGEMPDCNRAAGNSPLERAQRCGRRLPDAVRVDHQGVCLSAAVSRRNARKIDETHRQSARFGEVARLGRMHQVMAAIDNDTLDRPARALAAWPTNVTSRAGSRHGLIHQSDGLGIALRGDELVDSAVAIGSQRQPARLVIDGLPRPPEFAQGRGHSAMGLGEVRLQRQCRAIGRQRVREASQFVERQPAIAVQLRGGRAGLECAVKARQGVGVAGKCAQHRAAIGMQLGRYLSEPEGPFDVRERFLVASLPMRDDAEKMQGVAMIGLREQNFFAQPFGLGKVSRPLRRRRALQQLRQRAGWFACFDVQLQRRPTVEEAIASP